MDKTNETDIALSIQNPDTRREAFREIVSTYSQPLYWQIRRLVLSHEDANDVLQNTFVKAWENIEQFRGDSQLSTWLYRIAINESINFLKRKKAELYLSIDDEECNIIHQLEDDPYFDGDALQLQLQQAIGDLPEKQKIIFQLRYFQEMKYDEISQIMNTSIGALKASYHHAVKKIKTYFDDMD